MWQHLILESLPKYDYISYAGEFGNMLNALGKDVAKAPCFYFGDLTHFYKDDAEMDAPVSWDAEYIKSVRLPYPTCMFEFKAIIASKKHNGKEVLHRLVLLVYEEKMHHDPIPLPGFLVVPIMEVASSNKGEFHPPMFVATISQYSGVTCHSVFELAEVDRTEDTDEVLKTHKALFIDMIHRLHKLLFVMSCKNVIAEVVEPPEKLNKRRIKRDKPFIRPYHVLTVKTGERKIYLHEGTTQQGEHLPYHQCRGHFKEFTEDAPLFGKYTGRYWWKPHYRGSTKVGESLNREYKVI